MSESGVDTGYTHGYGLAKGVSLEANQKLIRNKVTGPIM